MFRPISQQDLIRGNRQLLTVLFSIGALLMLFVGFSAFGQTVDVEPPTDTSTPSTVLGWIFKGLLTLLVLVIGWVVFKVGGFITSKTKAADQSAIEAFMWSTVNKAWLKATNVGARLFAKEKALIEKILADGTVTPEEWKELCSKIEIDIKLELQMEIPILAQFLNGAGPVTSLIQGFASKITTSLLTGKAAILPDGAAPVIVAAPKPDAAAVAGAAVPS